MTGYDDFETRLEQAMRRYGDQALLPFDPDAIAERAIGAGSPRPAWRAVLVPVLLLALLLAVAAGIVTLTRPDPRPEPIPTALGGSLLNPAGQGHVAARLADGRVLVVHGDWEDMGQSVSSTAEVWDPASGSSVAVTDEMTLGRISASAVTLQDGRVLLIGGFGGPYAYSSSAVASAELWDPTTGQFSATGDPAHARVGHVLSLLPDGRVLVTGGSGMGGVAEAEVYDPASGQFSPAGSMSVARSGHSATVLGDGRVLVIGGRAADNASAEALDSAEIWTPQTNTFEPAGNLASARADHTATALPDGRILFVGGYIGGGYQTDGTGARQEVINPPQSFLDDFVGEAETWDPNSGFAAAGTLATARTAHTATVLADGRVAVIGGVIGGEEDGRVYLTALDSVEIWDAATQTFAPGQRLAEPRADHSALAMPDGSVMLVGGQMGLNELASVAVWREDPLPGDAADPSPSP